MICDLLVFKLTIREQIRRACMEKLFELSGSFDIDEFVRAPGAETDARAQAEVVCRELLRHRATHAEAARAGVSAVPESLPHA